MNNITKTRIVRGFTLIELLVVIAIIGILAAVVLASLNSARTKGNLANVKENLAHVRGQAEIDYSNNGCYSTGTCTAASTGQVACPTSVSTYANTVFADQKVIDMLNGAKTYSGAITSCISYANADSYAISFMYPTDTTNAWCVDSSGNSKQETVSANTQVGVNGTIVLTNGKEVCK